MVASWWVVAPCIAAIITFAFMQAAVALAETLRRRDYRLFEGSNSPSFAPEFPLPAIESSADEHRIMLSPLVDAAHRAANAAQTAYHGAVVRYVVCLMLAFVALVLSTVPHEYYPSVDQQSAECVLTWVEAVTILFALAVFLYARTINRRWIVRRVGAELLRQYQFLSTIFYPEHSGMHPEELKSQFDFEAQAIERYVQEGSIADIISRAERFWGKRKASIEKLKLTETDIPADALVLYLRRRVLRQLGWFSNSKARLERVSDRRSLVLLTLYCIAAALAAAKLALFHRTGHSPAYLLPPLLFVTGISGAMTAYFVNQNVRSLIHRYDIQERRIREWLMNFNERWGFADLPSLTMTVSAKSEIRACVLQFEGLMVEEMIDWVHVTAYDRIELAA